MVDSCDPNSKKVIERYGGTYIFSVRSCICSYVGLKISDRPIGLLHSDISHVYFNFVGIVHMVCLYNYCN